MLQISVGIVDSVQQLALALVENLPSVSMYRLFLVYRALFKLFLVMRGKAEYFQDFIHAFGESPAAPVARNSPKAFHFSV